MIPATIEYTCDWHSKSGDDQRGHINIKTPTGLIEATWSCTGGMGDGCTLISNDTEELSDEDAEELLDDPELCQGNGTYTANIVDDGFGRYTIEDVVWQG